MVLLLLSCKDLAEAFADVTPVPLQEQHGSPVCQIAYPEEFTQAYEYLRAVLSQNERSGMSFWVLFRIVAVCVPCISLCC